MIVLEFPSSSSKYNIVAPWHLESVLSLNDDLSIQSLDKPDTPTYRDITVYQLLMRKTVKNPREYQFESGETHGSRYLANVQ